MMVQGNNTEDRGEVTIEEKTKVNTEEEDDEDNVQSLTNKLQDELVDSHVRAIQAFCETSMVKVLPGTPVLSTSTMTVKTNVARIDYLKIVDKVAAGEIPDLSLKKNKYGVVRVFRNCASFSVLLDGKSKGVKICANGTLHLTGVKCGAHAKAMLDTAIRGIEVAHESAGEVKVLSDSLKLNMLNYYFPLNVRLDLDALKRVIVERHKIAVLYDREKHPGIKFRSPSKKTTVIVFMTGNIFLSTVSSADDIVDAYKFISTIVEDNLDTVRINGSVVKNNKVKTDEINILDEIPSEDWDEIFNDFPLTTDVNDDDKKRKAEEVSGSSADKPKKSRRGRKTTAEHTDANEYLTDLLGL